MGASTARGLSKSCTRDKVRDTIMLFQYTIVVPIQQGVIVFDIVSARGSLLCYNA